jgi:hypothetical protein
MAISSVSSGISAATQLQSQPVRGREAENDKDKDDGAANAVAQAAAQRPSVNTSGQVVGSVINVQA